MLIKTDIVIIETYQDTRILNEFLINGLTLYIIS